jgi:hypothetical protein
MIDIHKTLHNILAPLSSEFQGIRLSEPAILVVPLIASVILFYRDAEKRKRRVGLPSSHTIGGGVQGGFLDMSKDA